MTDVRTLVATAVVAAALPLAGHTHAATTERPAHVVVIVLENKNPSQVDAQTGMLNLNLTRVLGGRLPVPQEIIVSPLRDKVGSAARAYLPSWQQRAAIDVTGWVNEPAVDAALTKDAVRILNAQLVDPVLFIPVDGRARVL